MLSTSTMSFQYKCVFTLKRCQENYFILQFLQIQIIKFEDMSFLYSMVKGFGWYSTQLCFRDITLINPQNLPEQGPTIIYGNHNNQFVDGLLLIRSIQRPISFIAAAIAFQMPVIGSLIKAVNCISVARPQDQEKQKGKGCLTDLTGNVLKGENTHFTKLTVDSTIYIEGSPDLKVKRIISDIQIEVSGDIQEFHNQNKAYEVLIKLQFDKFFSKVWSGLDEGRCIGIFPEGRSHDLLEVQPFKAGIAIMALGAMQKYGKPVKMVPCGFNYYNQFRFRSKVILQFGPTYEIPMELAELYKKDKRKACDILLTNLQNMLKSVTTQFDSYKDLFALFQARELYTLKAKRKVTLQQKLQLNRRFAKGYKLIRGNPKYAALNEKLLQFSRFVQISGLPVAGQDYFGSIFIDFFKFLFYFQKCMVRSLIALPCIIMFGPTTAFIRYRTEKYRKWCIQISKHKEKHETSFDVVTSEKIKHSLILFPITCAIHSTILYFALKKFTKLPKAALWNLAVGLFTLQPFYILLFVKSYDSFKRTWQKLKFQFFRLFKRNIYNDFSRQKRELQAELLQVVEEMGSQVVQNFDENRILKKQEFAQSELLIGQDQNS